MLFFSILGVNNSIERRAIDAKDSRDVISTFAVLGHFLASRTREDVSAGGRCGVEMFRERSKAYAPFA